MSLLAAVTYRFAALAWLWPAVAIGAIGFALIVWSYAKTPGPARTRLAGAALKTVGLALLLLCLLEPVIETTFPKPGENLFLVMADNSRSMRLRDADSDAPRAERMTAILDKRDANWINLVDEQYQLRRYLFDTNLHRTADFAGMDFAGDATALRAALAVLAERYRTRPVAGILVATDGAIADSPDAWPADLPPVFPVIVAGDTPARDAAVQRVSVSQSHYEKSPVSITAAIQCSGFEGDNVEVCLEDGDGKTVETQTLAIAAGAAVQSVQFRFKPEKTGVSFYTVRIVADGEEATDENNQRTLAVHRDGRTLPVLYVSGRPNWEFRFLNRAIQDDAQVNLEALIRVAKREPKFQFRGKAGEGNPLFEGFGKQDEDQQQRYDQPVLIRVNVKDPQALRDGFPKTAEALYKYRAVIIDDVEADYFTHEQMMLLQRFASDRGGGVLLLGGAETLGDGGYHRTPIGQMSPAYLDKLTTTPARQSKLSLTREGWLQPWVRLRDTQPAEQVRLRDMPGFSVLNAMGAAKPGASVIATVTDERGGVAPALIVQRYGAGISAVLAVGDMWRWAMQGRDQGEDLARAWRQLVRFVASEAVHPVTLRATRDGSEPVRLKCHVRDEKFEPRDRATVTMTVTLPDGSRARLSAEPSLEEPGVFEADYLPSQSGGHHAEAVVTDAAGQVIDSAATGWASDPAADEFRALRPNRTLLAQLAATTGGEVIKADALGAFAASLAEREAPITETQARPLWHTPWMFLLALLCLIGEWTVRRMRGMP